MGFTNFLSCLPCGTRALAGQCDAADTAGSAGIAEPKGRKNASAMSLHGLELRPYNAESTLAAAKMRGGRTASVERLWREERTSASSHTLATRNSVTELRRMSTVVPGAESGAALHLQKLCDLLRAKLAIPFACVDVFGTQRPCSCTLAASGCAEAHLPLALARLHTPADAAELRVLLPPSGGGHTSYSHLSASTLLSATTTSAGGGIRSTPTSPCHSLPVGGSGGGGSRRSAGGGAAPHLCYAVAASPMAGGAAANYFSTASPAVAPPPPPPSERERWSHHQSLHHSSNNQQAREFDRWSAFDGSRPSAAGGDRNSASAALWGPGGACAGGDRSSAGCVGGGDRTSAGQYSSAAASPRAYSLAASAAAASAAAAAAGMSPRAAAGMAAASAAAAVVAPPYGCFCSTSLESLPRHIRRLADQFDTDLRSFWVIPLLAPAAPNGGSAPGSPMASLASSPSRFGTVPPQPMPPSPLHHSSSVGVGNHQASGGGGGEAAFGGRAVLGVLYLMGGDELLFQLPRDVLDQFCRWLSDSIVEGQLRLIADLSDCMTHAVGPEAAVAAASAHLSDFFSHRTQGMAEVLAYPAFMSADAPSRAVVMLPPAANRLVSTAVTAAATAAAAELPVRPSPSIGGAVAVSIASLTAIAGGAGSPDAAGAAATALAVAAGAAAAVGAASGVAADSFACSMGAVSGIGGCCGGDHPLSSSLLHPDTLPPLQPFAVGLTSTLLHVAVTTGGGSRGQALRGSLRFGSAPSPGLARPLTRSLGGEGGGSVSRSNTNGGGSPYVSSVAAAPAHGYTDLLLLPGAPQYVLVGLLRDASAAGVIAATASSAASKPESGGGGGVQMGLYLSFSESLRKDLVREMQSTLDALLVLLAPVFGATLGSEAMRPQLTALLSSARAVDC